MKIIYQADQLAAATRVTQSLTDLTANGNSVLWLISGGSAIDIAVKACEQIVHPELINVSLVDERYGDIGHLDSNWQQLTDAGFPFERFAASMPVLNGSSMSDTVDHFAEVLATDQIVVAILGMGADSHTSGILPNSIASYEYEKAVIGYEGPDYKRITTTPKYLGSINHAILYVSGEVKHAPLRQFINEEHDATSYPVQFLKSINDLTVITDMEQLS